MININITPSNQRNQKKINFLISAPSLNPSEVKFESNMEQDECSHHFQIKNWQDKKEVYMVKIMLEKGITYSVWHNDYHRRGTFWSHGQNNCCHTFPILQLYLILYLTVKLWIIPLVLFFSVLKQCFIPFYWITFFFIYHDRNELRNGNEIRYQIPIKNILQFPFPSAETRHWRQETQREIRRDRDGSK